jgi:hypothetical protein
VVGIPVVALSDLLVAGHDSIPARPSHDAVPTVDSVMVGQDEDRWNGSAEGRRYLRLDIRIG